MEITDDKFRPLWQDISEALLRIAGQISPKKKTDWKKAIDKFLKDPLTAEDERNAQELLSWYRTDVEVKEFIESLSKNMREGLESFRLESQNMREGLESFRLESQDIKSQLGDLYQSMERLASSASTSQAAGGQFNVHKAVDLLCKITTQIKYVMVNLNHYLSKFTHFIS